MNYLKNIVFYLALAFVVNYSASQIESSFFADFLKDNIIVILVTLLAINTATSGLIISKLQELSQKHKTKFEKTYKSMRNSLLEQVILIVVCSITLILRESASIQKILNENYFYFDTIILAVFIYSLDILYDTGKAIFIIIDNLTEN
jgi:hypothetical protein